MERIIPEHIAIMMDGNGRWAQKRFLTRSAGHKAGAQALKKLVGEANKIGLKYMTVFAFSTENWKRSSEEVDSLMNLLRDYLEQNIGDAKKNDIKISIIGDVKRLPVDIQEKIAELTKLTESKTGMHTIIGINYGGRDDITRAVKKIAKDVKENILSIDDITEKIVSDNLDTADFPDPDLFIRTSGDLRVSNYLLWQFAYTEFYYSEKLWPDFTIDDLMSAIDEFNKRERRYGGR